MTYPRESSAAAPDNAVCAPNEPQRRSEQLDPCRPTAARNSQRPTAGDARWPARRRIARAALVSVVALATIGTAATLPAAAATQPAQPTQPAVTRLANAQSGVTRAASAAPFLAAVYRAKLRATADTNVNLGPQTWTGGTIVGPKGKVISSPYVTRWGELVLGVMAELKIDFAYFPGIMAQIQQESSGNPNAVNAWDSNAKAGRASMGLLQVIATTYQANARPGFKGTLTKISVPGTSVKQLYASPWQKQPYANLYSALRYVQVRYGVAKFKNWNAGVNTGY